MNLSSAPLTQSAQLLNKIAALNSASSYLEIGVEKGLTFSGVSVHDKVAVDPHFLFDVPLRSVSSGCEFFECTSDSFFTNYKGKTLDLVFLDGLHTFEQTLRDLLNVFQLSSKNTIILIDDVFPSDVYSALRSHEDAVFFREQTGSNGIAWHGDVYKLIFFIHDFCPRMSYATLDAISNRQTILWNEPRHMHQPLFNDLETISRLSYFDLHKHINIMHLMSEDAALSLIHSYIK